MDRRIIEMSEDNLNAVRDNTELQRFELESYGVTAYSTYTRDAGVVTVVHTRVPPEASGKGLGTALVEGVLGLIRAKGEKIVPVCPFVAAYMRRHPETQALLADPDYLVTHDPKPH
jgi:uncharacterized protein